MLTSNSSQNLEKSAKETHNLLTEVYGDQCLSHTQVFEWFKKFKEGRDYVGDDPKSGRPSTAKTQENVEKVARIFEETADCAFEQFLNLPTSIRKVLDRFCTTIWA